MSKNISVEVVKDEAISLDTCTLIDKDKVTSVLRSALETHSNFILVIGSTPLRNTEA